MQKKLKDNSMLKNILVKFKYCLTLIFIVVLFTGCSTGSTLRTARVLEKGEVEFSAGIAGTECGNISPVLVGAYGATDKIEIEARCEDDYIAVTPRLQLLKSELSFLDCLTFFEVGYSDEGGFQWGPGIMIGRRWKYIEPYASYRYRHYSPLSKYQRENLKCQKFLLGAKDYHYLKLGSRFYFPNFWSQNAESHPKWFLGLECGPTLFGSDAIFEWAANIGFVY